MSETAFEAQRRKMRALKEKQNAGGEAAVPATHTSPKAAKRRAAEAAAKPVAKKKSKKKTSTTD